MWRWVTRRLHSGGSSEAPQAGARQALEKPEDAGADGGSAPRTAEDAGRQIMSGAGHHGTHCIVYTKGDTRRDGGRARSRA